MQRGKHAHGAAALPQQRLRSRDNTAGGGTCPSGETWTNVRIASARYAFVAVDGIGDAVGGIAQGGATAAAARLDGAVCSRVGRAVQTPLLLGRPHAAWHALRLAIANGGGQQTANQPILVRLPSRNLVQRGLHLQGVRIARLRGHEHVQHGDRQAHLEVVHGEPQHAHAAGGHDGVLLLRLGDHGALTKVRTEGVLAQQCHLLSSGHQVVALVLDP